MEKGIRRTAAIALLAVQLVTVHAQGVDSTRVPVWVKESRSIVADSIPEADYAFLTKWANDHVLPADEYFIKLFTRHDLIIFGESHNVREHKDFIIKLIPRLYYEAGVRCIGWEFTTPSSDVELESLVTSLTYDYNAQLDFARRQGSHALASKEHWDIIEAVRKLNSNLPPESEKMRLVGLDKEIDWVDVYIKQKTATKDSPEMKALNEIEQRRDVEMAENAERQTLAKGIKALLFVGRGHAETHFGLPPDPPYRRPIMAQVLYKKYGERVYQVYPDFGSFTPINKAMKCQTSGPVGFDIPGSPFASLLIIRGPGFPLSTLESNARGYIYFGPQQTLHRNTFIEGFVTDEMFAKYKRYYEIDFGKVFNSAADVNTYFREKALSKLK